ncbi:hypothetical protein [Phytohabitans suffuscus]|uniref:Lipoprotein LpqB beta-propeller domain-containing protein n=1 Tax=Phytohabitans suffuscus TaxID=624315 RepID=A0A6F8YWC3_9ACTN|nr:hypothetical protein [Phytohabitans suffuscus]BCB90151.1 hypothetical protein Psuf_074640 [Phytohabitans suffuscus]
MSWSPDGHLLVLTQIEGGRARLAFIPAGTTTAREPVPDPIDLRGDGLPEILGWRDAGTMLVGIDNGGGYESAGFDGISVVPSVHVRRTGGPS